MACMGELIASICWFIWKARNKTHFDKEVWPLGVILDKTITLISEFKEANSLKSSPRSYNPLPILSWNPPPVDAVKRM